MLSVLGHSALVVLLLLSSTSEAMKLCSLLPPAETLAFDLAATKLKGLDATLTTSSLTQDLSDVYLTVHAFEELVRDGCELIIGPRNSDASVAVSPAATHAGVPFISPSATADYLTTSAHPYFVRLQSSDFVHAEALLDTASYFNWTRLVLVVGPSDFAKRAADAINVQALQRGLQVLDYVALDENNITGQVSKLPSTGRVFVLVCMPDIGASVLKAAGQLDLVDRVWLAHPDAIRLSLDAFNPSEQEKLVGLLSLGFFSAENSARQAFETQWKNEGGAAIALDAYILLAYDSTLLAGTAIKAMVPTIDPPPVTCGESLPVHPSGQLLLQGLKDARVAGVTGELKLNPATRERSTDYSLNNIKRGTNITFVPVGLWSQGKGYIPDDTVAVDWGTSLRLGESVPSDNFYPAVWDFYHPIETMGAIAPMWKDNYTAGFMPDLIEYVRDFVEREHNIKTRAVPFKPLPDYQGYTGMLEYMDKNQGVFITLADASMSVDRASLVDFGVAFTSQGLTSLADKARLKPGDMFSFLNPFTPGIWFTIIGTMVVFGVVVFELERRNNDAFPVSFRGFKGALWYSVLVLFFSQDKEIKNTKTRVVLACWMLAILILNAAYTANLANYLLSTRAKSDVEDLLSISRSAPVMTYCGNAGYYWLKDVQLFQSLVCIDDFTTAMQTVDNDGAIAIAIERPFALAYAEQSDCNVEVVGLSHFKQNWGFSFKRDTPPEIKLAFDEAVLKAWDDGFLAKLDEKYMTTNACADRIEQVLKSTSDAQLGLENVGGIFIIVFGAIFGVMIWHLVTLLLRRIHKEVVDLTDSEGHKSKSDEVELAEKDAPNQKLVAEALPEDVSPSGWALRLTHDNALESEEHSSGDKSRGDDNNDNNDNNDDDKNDDPDDQDGEKK